MLRLFLRRKRLLLALAAVILLELGVLAFSGGNPAAPGGSSLAALAAEVKSTCAAEKHPPSCYDEAIPKLMDNISLEDAFEVTRILQTLDPTYQYCHVLGHNLSAREIQKDPSKWKDVLTRCPSGMCSNGCLHGGLQERFRSETFTPAQLAEVKPDLLDICEPRGEWRPTGLEQASCYHALGHLTMYLTNADIRTSLDLCREVTVKPDGRSYLQLCYDGAFMQIFQPLEPEDFELIQGKEVAKEELGDFCKGFQGIARASCWSEGWPLFRKELQKPEGLVEFCSKTEEAARLRCYNALVYVITPQFGFDAKRLRSYCLGLPEEFQPQCVANVASRMIETDYRKIDPAVKFCEGTGAENESACYQELAFYAGYNFHPGSAEVASLCGQLPSPWREKCPAQNLGTSKKK